MQQMKIFLDTHDKDKGTFPAELTPTQFGDFYAQYEQACLAEDVIVMNVHVGYEEGRAFCLTMAPDAKAVERAHARVGLPFDSITEVKTATAGDTFFQRHTATE